MTGEPIIDFVLDLLGKLGVFATGWLAAIYLYLDKEKLSKSVMNSLTATTLAQNTAANALNELSGSIKEGLERKTQADRDIDGQLQRVLVILAKLEDRR